MDFTREPIIETVVTPREGCKLVLRNSKNGSQEEYFVDAVEVVSFGSSFFFRSLERPKCFLVPVTDYEILEVRETRMVLKNVGVDRSIKIGGGRASSKESKESKETKESNQVKETPEKPTEKPSEEPRGDKKRDRRRHARRRRGRDGAPEAEATGVEEPKVPEVPARRSPQLKGRGRGSKETKATSAQGSKPSEGGSENSELSLEEQLGFSSPMFSTLLPPPPRLISETISQYRDKDEYKGAFYEPELDEGAQTPQGESTEGTPTETPAGTESRSGRGGRRGRRKTSLPSPVTEATTEAPSEQDSAQSEPIEIAEKKPDEPTESAPEPSVDAPVAAEEPVASDSQSVEEVPNGNQAPA